MRPLLLLFSIALAAPAQLPPPNAAGLAMGHLHLKVRDVEAQKKFWQDKFGAAALKLGQFDVMKLPDLLVLIQPGEPSGGTEGSVVGHVALKVRDVKSTPGHNMVTGPEGVEVELMPDAKLGSPAANHHIHFYTGDVAAMKAWYVKMFGAVPGRRGRFEAADLPGVNLTFSPAEAPTAPLKGRVLDHIGFEVRNLEAFSKRLEAAGVKFDVPYRKLPSLGIALAFLTDPWGTYIELTEGLDRL